MSDLFRSSLLSSELTLKRYFDVDKNLQAWDAADSYLLEVFGRLGLAEEKAGQKKSVWVLNDDFGALAISLLVWSAEQAQSLEVVVYSDSYLAVTSIKNNLQKNASLLNEKHLNTGHLTFIHSLDEFASITPPDVVIGRVPKAKSQLIYILDALSRKVHKGCELLLSGMDKHLSKGQYGLLEKHYGDSTFMPGKKKARIWRATCNVNSKQEADSKEYQVLDYAPVITLANNFSFGKLDLGARLLIENMNRLGPAKKVIDLACGNGVLGLVYSAMFNPPSILFSDESYQAIKASELNFVEWSGADHIDANKTQAQFRVDNALEQQDEEPVDLIICNPPFHQQNSVSTTMAMTLFKDALRCLTKRGEVWVVANRHLGYHVVLRRLFKNCRVVASNDKFVLLRAVKKQ